MFCTSIFLWSLRLKGFTPLQGATFNFVKIEKMCSFFPLWLTKEVRGGVAHLQGAFGAVQTPEPGLDGSEGPVHDLMGCYVSHVVLELSGGLGLFHRGHQPLPQRVATVTWGRSQSKLTQELPLLRLSFCLPPWHPHPAASPPPPPAAAGKVPISPESQYPSGCQASVSLRWAADPVSCTPVGSQ